MRKFTRVLIVDDENMFRDTLRNLLSWENEGFLLVGFAENGKQALSLLDATQPQIIITDVAMPVMNGIDLVREIERRNALPQYQNNPIGVIVISGFETFSYVRDAMRHGAFDYILKSELSSTSLLQRLNALTSCLPTLNGSAQLEFSQFFTNLMDQNYSDSHFVQEQLECYHLTLRIDQPLFLIKAFSSDKSEEFVQSRDARRLLMEALRGEPAAVFLSHGTCMVLGNMTVLESVRTEITAASEEFPSLYWGVYQDGISLQEFRRILSDLSQIPQQFFYAPNRKIFSYETTLTFTVPAPPDFTVVDTAVAQNDFQKILLFLGNFLGSCAKGNISPYALRKYCEQLIYTLLLSMEKQGIDVGKVNLKKIEYFRKVDLSSTIDELCDTLDGIFSDIFSCTSTPTEANRALFNEINAFILQNYQHSIRLLDVAEHVHISYHHLSRILNAYCQVPFNDYLNGIRVQKAQSLLRTTSHSLGRIAEEVGFTDQSYFGKIFKKHTGISPRLYRLQYKESNP